MELNKLIFGIERVLGSAGNCCRAAIRCDSILYACKRGVKGSQSGWIPAAL